MSYNLRSHKNLKVVEKKNESPESSDAESDESEEYTTDEDASPEHVVNIVLHVKQEDDDESESESEMSDESEECEEDPKSDAFMEQLATIGAMVEYKDVPAYQQFMKNHESLLESQSQKRKRKDRKIRQQNRTEFQTLLNGGSMTDKAYFKTLSLEKQKKLMMTLSEIRKLNQQISPIRIQLLESNIPIEYKCIALEKMEQLDKTGEGEAGKINAWLSGFMKLPFGIYHTLSVDRSKGIPDCHAFMVNAKEILDSCTYGLDDAKLQIMQYVGQLLANPSSIGTVIAFEGPMGTGKTTLVKEGISKILQRPFAFITLGGAQDASFLNGHSITYEGSVWGTIANVLMQSKCMNPVIYFDELDKISNTPKGEEIVGVLTHLTDSSQNGHFQDVYFNGIDLDLSKVTFVFSYNDRNKVNPILRDRMSIIKTVGYTTNEKIMIAKRHLIQHIEVNIAFHPGDIVLPDPTLQHIIEHYTGGEKGVRNLKRCLESIYSKVNLFRFMPTKVNIFGDALPIQVVFPMTILPNHIDKLIKDDEKKCNLMMYV
jgi:ATP-dependent Lon protease